MAPPFSSSLATCLQSLKDPQVKNFNRYCCLFACGKQRFYRIDELFALLDSVRLALAGCIEIPDPTSPYVFVYLPNDAIASVICSQSFTMKKIMRHWVTVPDRATWVTGISTPQDDRIATTSTGTSDEHNSPTYPAPQTSPSFGEEAGLFTDLQSYIFDTFSAHQRFKLEYHRYGKGKGFTKAEFESIVDQLIAALKAATALGTSHSTSLSLSESESLWKGVVDLQNPDLVLCFWEGGPGSREEAAGQSQGLHVGRLVLDNKKSSRMVDRFHLRKGRPFLGPTSMDCELSFIMSTLGGCRPGALVLDPFVGSGSILVSATKLGAECVGCDIDMRILTGHGIKKTKSAGIADNFTHYGLRPPDILCSSQNCRTWRLGGEREGYFDAIVTDPPYGVRAGARKIASAASVESISVSGGADSEISGGWASSCRIVRAKEEVQGADQQKGGGRLYSKGSRGRKSVPYSTVECLDDLLDLAAEVLVIGGKLVFFLPSSADCGGLSSDISEKYLSHPCLERVSCSEDFSSVGRGNSVLRRHLLVMRKIAAWADRNEEGEGDRQEALTTFRSKRNAEDRDVDVCVRDVGASVYKDSRRKVFQ